eukprot:1389060-Rhodomonas_salina.2
MALTWRCCWTFFGELALKILPPKHPTPNRWVSFNAWDGKNLAFSDRHLATLLSFQERAKTFANAFGTFFEDSSTGVKNSLLRGAEEDSQPGNKLKYRKDSLDSDSLRSCS